MTDAYHAGSALEAEAALLALAKELDPHPPRGGGEPGEGLDETWTVLRLNVPPTLARTEDQDCPCHLSAMPLISALPPKPITTDRATTSVP